MRYIIYGAGAVGGVIGAKLHLAGHDVVLIARGAHLAALQDTGLELRAPDETFHLKIPAVSRPAEIEFRDGDVAVLTMKSQDTEAALDELRLAAGDQIPVVCCQNGVENERQALRRFENVYGVFVVLPAAHLEPGVVETSFWPTSASLTVGRYPRGTDALTDAIVGDWTPVGLSTIADADIMRWKYGKLYQNLGNAVQAVCGVDPGTREVLEKVQAEAKACLDAAGVDWFLDDSVRTASVRRAQNLGRGFQGTSTWQSLLRETGSVEVDHLNGEIVLLGRLHGVPTPANEVVQMNVVRMAHERLAPGSIGVAAVREQIERREAAPSASSGK